MSMMTRAIIATKRRGKKCERKMWTEIWAKKGQKVDWNGGLGQGKE
jgi:hypothetical protein